MHIRPSIARCITPALLAFAFLLLLLVTLSVPIIKSISLFTLAARASSGLLHSSASESVKFGAFGYCTSGADVNIIGIDRKTAGHCTKPHLGYSFDSTIAELLHVSNFENLISKGLTAVLALHPLVTALTFATLLISLFMLRRGSHGTSRLPALVALIAGLLTAVLTTIVLLIDVVLVAMVRKRVHNDTDGILTLTWGSAAWLVLCATIAIWIANVGLCIGVRAGNRHRAGLDAEKA
ncbi:pali-domain-containing protein [Mycena belliarum]|uniref:Pali-domain-containing protein n=1 Tax=Mycena belliarum TaxID=1033014 RepID=A0AAD6UBH3_9AGAR|nr:pali-domain-containing protein [Mycena belliae]